MGLRKWLGMEKVRPAVECDEERARERELKEMRQRLRNLQSQVEVIRRTQG